MRLGHKLSTVIALFGLSIFITACMTAPRSRGEAESLVQVTLESIELAYTSGEYEQVLQDLQLLEKRFPENDFTEEIEEYTEGSLKGLSEKYSTLLDSGDLLETESLSRTLLSLSLMFSDYKWDRQTLSAQQHDQLMKHLETGDKLSPVPLVNRFLFKDLSAVTMEELLKVGTYAAEEGNSTVAERIAGEISTRKEVLPEELEKFLSGRKASPGEQLPAVATVWVNRGMTIRDGVGRSDRVIGSGFFIDKRGYLITNYHVISSEVDPSYEGFSRLYVKFSDDRDVRIPARVVGYSKIFDLALLKTEREPDQVLSFSLNEEFRAGERIYAIGSPGGLENTLTAGIVSSSGRRFLQLGDVVQVDVPINQGNSGGPLLDEKGELIGVVFAGIEQFEGVNFAIPAKWALFLLDGLYEGGSYPHAYLGISVRERSDGLEVIYVAPGSPALRAGVQVGDIMTAFDGNAVKKLLDIHPLIVPRRSGELVFSQWNRDGEERELLIRLGEREEIPFKRYASVDLPENLFPPLFGMSIDYIGGGLFSDRFQVREVFPGTMADETGFSPLDPFVLQRWQILEDPPVAVAQIRVKKRKAGFLESGVQLAAYLETTNFL
jgi:serine protease Do